MKKAFSFVAEKKTHTQICQKHKWKIKTTTRQRNKPLPQKLKKNSLQNIHKKAYNNETAV